MKRYHYAQLLGFTLIELLVALVIVGAVLVGSFAGFKAFSDAVRVAMEENSALEDASIAIALLRADLGLSGWGIPTASRVAGDDAGGITIQEASFSVDIDGNGGKTDAIVTDRLFVADSIKLVRDSVEDRHFPDGEVVDAIAVQVADAEDDGGQKALLMTAAVGATSVVISTTNVNYETETSEGWYSGYNCNDIVDNRAIIIGGNTVTAGYAVEGHRISSITTGTGNQKCNGVLGNIRTGDSTISFITTNGTTLAHNYKTDTGSFGVPAVAWYIRKADDAVYWLYRNQHKVLANVVDFQVAYGIDVDRDGLEWSGTVVPGSALWARPEHTLDYLSSDDPAAPIPVTAPNSGEVTNHLRTQEAIESVRAVWIRLTLLRHGGAEEDAEDNIVATSYVTVVNLHN